MTSFTCTRLAIITGALVSLTAFISACTVVSHSPTLPTAVVQKYTDTPVASPMSPESPTASSLAFVVLPGKQKYESFGPLYVIDLKTLQMTLVAESVYNYGIWHPWSPNGKYLGLGIESVVGSQRNLVIDLEHKRTAKLESVRNGFCGWSATSRYAFFCWGDQYGHSFTTLFDTQAWKEIGQLGSWYNDASSPCSDDIIAISSKDNYFLSSYGVIHRLPDFTPGPILPLQGECVYSAAWSPDEAYLAFVTSSRDDKLPYTLYLAQGDFTQAQRIVVVSELGRGRLQWEHDKPVVVLSAKSERYIVDAATAQVNMVARAPTMTPPASKIASCSLWGEDKTLSLNVGDYRVACWSYDGAQLAVGVTNALKLYDSQFHLLHEVSVPGTPSSLSWYPQSK